MKFPTAFGSGQTLRPSVSIVIPTYNRLEHLKRCIDRIRRNVSLPHEIIVVGGDDSGQTGRWTTRQPDITYIRETHRQGAVRAFDTGFRAAVGHYAMWLNDDSYPLPGSVEAAVRMIERPELDDVGMIAFYHNFDRQRNRLDTVVHDGMEFSIYNVRGYPYANFGLIPRRLIASLGFLDRRYYFAAWDPDLSLKVQFEAGLKVVGCPDAMIFHDELIDERKADDLGAWDDDNAKLFAKWQLPERFSYPDPAPAYQQMIRQRLAV